MTYLIIEWTGSAVIVSRFLLRRGALVFQGKASRPAAVESDLTEILRELVPMAGDDCRIVLALPFSRLFSREIDLPIRDRRKFREVLPFELKGETALETDELVFDGVPLGDGKVLAVWGKKRELAALIAAAAAGGAEPEIVTVPLLHWVHLLPEEGRSVCIAVTDGTALAVYCDGEPLFFRALVEADRGKEVTGTLAALEIGKGIAVERVYLHGAAARGGDSAITGISLTVAGGLSVAFGGDDGAARDGAGVWALAQAIFAGEAADFRSGELAYTKGREKAQRQLRLPFLLAAVLALLLIVDAGIRYYLVKKDLASLDASIGAVYREAFPDRKKGVDEAAELRAEIRKLGGGAGGGVVLTVLKKLAEAKGDEIAGLFEADIDGDQVRIKGDARSAQAVTDFKARLGGVLASVEVGEIKSRPDGGVTFSLRGSLKGVEK